MPDVSNNDRSFLLHRRYVLKRKSKQSTALVTPKTPQPKENRDLELLLIYNRPGMANNSSEPMHYLLMLLRLLTL